MYGKLWKQRRKRSKEELAIMFEAISVKITISNPKGFKYIFGLRFVWGFG